MKLNIKDLAVKELDVDSNGIVFEVKDTKANNFKFLGKLIVTNTNLIWCKGKTTKENGVKTTWKKFMDMMEEK